MKMRYAIAIAATTALLLTVAPPAGAHGATRSIGYNVVYTSTPSPVCSYDIQHGNYGSAYLNGKMNTSGCRNLVLNVTGCSGLDCPTSPNRSTPLYYTWYTASLPAPYQIVYSHTTAYFCSPTSSPCTIHSNFWHNSL